MKCLHIDVLEEIEINCSWAELSWAWAEQCIYVLELNNVHIHMYTSLSWKMYIYTSLSWTMYIYTSLSCIVCTTVQNVILSCIFSTYVYIQWKFKSVGIIHLTLHIILRYNSFLPYPSCVCIVFIHSSALR